MMANALEGWKSCASVGTAGSSLAAKSKVTKLRLKNWSYQANLSAFSVKKLEARLDVIDKRAAVVGFVFGDRIVAELWFFNAEIGAIAVELTKNLKRRG
ncbi:hypothetical protein LWI29_001390 [Acer saccharum]|uniref:Uncharacterized protein n=1 Tax=Acer saccharum TaxID=4024 RepID=A0AA39VKU8_ACESA|nr:hypothetical protein LWI29_001390 [Acer saccharum]